MLRVRMLVQKEGNLPRQNILRRVATRGRVIAFFPTKAYS